MDIQASYRKMAREINKLSLEEFIDRYPHTDFRINLYEESEDSKAFEAFEGGLGIGIKKNKDTDPLELRFRLLWIDSKKFLTSVQKLWGISLEELDNNFSHVLDYVQKLFKTLNLHKLITQSFLSEASEEIPQGRFEGIFWIDECPEWYFTSDTDIWDKVNNLKTENPESLVNLLETDDPRMLQFLVEACDINLIKDKDFDDPRIRYEQVCKLDSEDLEEFIEDPHSSIRREVARRLPKEHLKPLLEDPDKQVKLIAYIRLLS